MNNINWKLKKYQLKAANTGDVLKKQVYLLKVNQYLNLASKSQYGGALPAGLQEIATKTKEALQQVIEGFSKQSVNEAVSEISTKVDEFKGSYGDLAKEFVEVSKLAVHRGKVEDFPAAEKDKILQNIHEATADEVINQMVAESFKESAEAAAGDAAKLAEIKAQLEIVTPEIKAKLTELLGDVYAHKADLGL